MVDVDIWEECALRNFDCEECTGLPQYVSEVVDFSSQYGSDISISYTAYNITGKPSKFPDYGDFPQAFVMVSDSTERLPLCMICNNPIHVQKEFCGDIDY